MNKKLWEKISIKELSKCGSCCELKRETENKITEQLNQKFEEMFRVEKTIIEADDERVFITIHGTDIIDEDIMNPLIKWFKFNGFEFHSITGVEVKGDCGLEICFVHYL